MKAALAPLLCLALVVSCVTHKTKIYGVGETETTAVFGDGSAANTVLGDTIVYKNSTATRILAQMFMGLVTATAMGNAAEAKQITDRMATAGANQAQIETARIAAQTAALKIGAGTTSEAVKGGLFQQGMTIFKQPGT